MRQGSPPNRCRAFVLALGAPPLFQSIFGALFPVFGLILLGVVLGRIDLLGARAFEVLNRFVIAVTLPVLTFRVLAKTSPADLAAPTMIVAVLGGAFVIYAAGFVIERLAGRTRVEANIAGLSSCYSNTGFVGLPIALLAFGPASFGPVAVTMALYAAVVFTVALVLSEVVGGGAGPGAALARAGRAMVRSPLIVLSVLGVAWAFAGLPLGGAFDTLLATIAGATAPCALVAIGLFIALPREEAAVAPIARIVALKLIAHPLVTFGLLQLLPPLPPLWSATAILMAAMPAGASSFVLAGRAGRWAMELSAWSITLTTAFAAISLIPMLWLLQP